MVRPVSALALVLGFVACGGSPQVDPVVRPPPLVITASPPPPGRAKWSFSHPEKGLLAKLDLGDGSVLYAGQNGRREIVKGNDAPVDAQTLALEDIVGILKDDKGQFAFVADDGDVYLAKEALGNLDTTREGPMKDGKEMKSVTTGKVAIMGIAPDGRVMRSADYGQSWKEVDYAGSTKPYGKPVALALDGKGNGLLLHLPQRVFATKDDGASWQPIATPGIGARRVRRDGAGKLFLDGFGGKRAKLDGSALSITTESEQPLYKPPPTIAAATSGRGRHTSILSGERQLEFAAVEHKGKTIAIEVTTTKLGEKPEKPVQVGDLVGANGLSERVTGFGADVVYLRDDLDGDDPAPTSTLYRSSDYGATWHKDATLQGADAQSSEGVDIALGPKGWTYVTALCPPEQHGEDDEEEGMDDEDYEGPEETPERSDCNHRQIKPAGANAFEDMAFVEEFTPLEFAFDEKNAKVYAIGQRDSKKYVYESPLDKNKFSRTKIIEADSYTPTSITVDKNGTLRVFSYESSKGWVLNRRDKDGKEMPKLYIPLDRGDIELVGSRGVLFAGHEKGWETNDGGENWIRVATNGFARNLECTEAGCINGDAVRVGWDLPAVTTQEKIPATTEPKPQTKSYTPPTPPSPGAPNLELQCKPAGATTTVTSIPSSDALDNRVADVRWTQIKRDTDGKTSVLVASKTSVKEVALMGARPKPVAGAKGPQAEHREGERNIDGGIASARYSFMPRTGPDYNPVDVELAWYSPISGKVGHQTLKQVKAFRVSRYGFSGSPAIVDGGFLFQPESSQPVTFIHDDGKTESITIPKDLNLQNVLHMKNKWVIGSPETGGMTLALSDDNAKTWKSKGWGLEENTYPSLSLFGDKPIVTIKHGQMAGLLFDIGALPDDPPAPTVIDASSVSDPCDAKAGRSRFVQAIAYDKRTFKAVIETKTGKDTNTAKVTASTRVLHDTTAGKMCTSAYVATGSDTKTGESQTAFLYPEGAGWSGWRFRRSDDKTKYTYVAEPLTCTAPK